MRSGYIGGIPEQEIADLFQAKGIPGDAGADRAIRFLRKLSDLIARRWAAGEHGTGAVFLLAEKVSDAMKGRKGVSKPTLVNGNDPISDGVWLVNAQVGNAHALALEWETGASLAVVVDAGLGDLPAVTIDLRDKSRPPQVLFFPDGCVNLDSMLTLFLGDQPIDEGTMKGTLDDFYQNSLRTPMTVLAGHSPDRIWKDSGKGVPQARPEESIEGMLLRHLKAVFPDHDPRAQNTTDDGYLDIAVHYADRTVQGHPARRCDWVLELKALADRTTNDNPSSANVEEAVTKGVRQTIAYSTAENSLERALCVYDLRDVANDDETCFDHVREDATDNQIHLWRWRLMRSAEEGRKERYPLKADSPTA
ncbi:hypothetical protein MOV61_02925 [Neorhizobium sp. BETTINA12A]|uniref:hypothetical protein n=1 Tax=Neorhizobium sp. BETTINA12A TaxID=2908924 RepID=UPI001FF47800|nr:hypothetical protein [Neorhizobium sp. BETTINA12A]MCJ9749669.1 hypothetical protein [Neorhizobium sp. BETTINA12A]